MLLEKIFSRIAITGMSLIGPLGFDVEESWENLVACKSGISSLDKSPLMGKTLVTCFGYVGESSEPLYNRLDPLSTLSQRDYEKLGEVNVLAYAAADQAMRDAGMGVIEDDHEAERGGVIVGTGVGGLAEAERRSIEGLEKERGSPFTLPVTLSSSPAGFICSKYNFRSFNNTVVTACASGSTAMVEAVNQIRMCNADFVLCGGVEFAEIALGIRGFDSMMALSRKHKPQAASRPWDKERDGFVMAEGAAMFMLEDMERAKKRGARIHAEIAGTGVSVDAYSLVAPEPNGRGMIAAMEKATKAAGISTDQIDYINAHATSTPAGDRVEALGVRKFMGEGVEINMSSTKSSTGHMLGTAGSAETVFCIKAMQHGVMPATLNLHNPIEETQGINLIPLEPQENKSMHYVMNNSFGFGGTNVCLILKKI